MNESERIIRQSPIYQKLLNQYDQVNQQLLRQLKINDQQNQKIMELYQQVDDLQTHQATLLEKVLTVNNENSKLNDVIDELNERPKTVIVKYPDKNYQDLTNELSTARQDLADVQRQYDFLNNRYQKLREKMNGQA